MKCVVSILLNAHLPCEWAMSVSVVVCVRVWCARIKSNTLEKKIFEKFSMSLRWKHIRLHNNCLIYLFVKQVRNHHALCDECDMNNECIIVAINTDQLDQIAKK